MQCITIALQCICIARVHVFIRCANFPTHFPVGRANTAPTDFACCDAMRQLFRFIYIWIVTEAITSAPYGDDFSWSLCVALLTYVIYNNTTLFCMFCRRRRRRLYTQRAFPVSTGRFQSNQKLSQNKYMCLGHAAEYLLRFTNGSGETARNTVLH